MDKASILNRANKDIAAAKKRGIKPTTITNRDPYPQAPNKTKNKGTKKG